MKMLRLTVLMIALTYYSACAANHYAMRKNDSSADSIVIENTKKPTELYVIVKGQRSLNDALERLHCRKQPCMIGRIGEVYIVERPNVQ
jgi:hypothetical protein